MSTSVIKYWRGRLEAVCPYFSPKYLEDEAYTKWDTLQRTSWPDYVSQRALYADYCEWFDAVITSQLSLDLYETHEVPNPAHSRDFNAILRPFINCGDWAGTYNRRVPVPRNYQGTWFNEQKFQRFYRLSPWKKHADAYSAITGTSIDLSNTENLDLTKLKKYETVS